MSKDGELKIIALELAQALGKIGYPTKEKDVLPHIEKEHWLISEALHKAYLAGSGDVDSKYKAALERIAMSCEGREEAGLLPNERYSANLPKMSKPDWLLAEEALKQPSNSARHDD